MFILVASYVFYGWWDWRFVFLLAASTACTVAGGRLVHMARNDVARRAWMITTVALELGLLGWFKYAGWLSVNVDNVLHHLGMGDPVPLVQVTLPVGISFFTFMGLSYVIDVYRGSLEPSPWLDVAVFVAFFPHLVAGPIVRGSDLLPQIRRAHRRDPRRIALPSAPHISYSRACSRRWCSRATSPRSFVDPVFANPHTHSSLEVLLGIWGYAVQIYCDFSGYTDIAIGCALLLGFRFPENFNAPYTARSLQDFWRRWHMTLSSWLRDYLYIPLGGNHGSRAAMYRNIMITMVLGGVWHGAAWTFVAWGGLHGIGQCVGHFRRAKRVEHGLSAQREGRWWVAWERFATFQLVCVGWVFFRASSFANAFAVFGRLFTGWTRPSPLVNTAVLLTLVVGIGSQYVPKELPLRRARGVLAA